MTLGQVTANHRTQPPTFLSSQLGQPLVFQLEDVREQGYIYQEGDGIFHWRFGIQDLFQTENTTIKIVSSPSVCPLNQPSDHEQVVFRLYLNSDGTSCKPQAAAFFVAMAHGSIIYSGRVSVTLHNHLRSIQLVRECDTSVDGSNGAVRIVCGCPNFFSMHTMRQSAKAGIVCVDIQFI